MEALAGLVVLGALLALLVLPIVALVQASRAVREAGALRKDLGQLDARLAALARRVVGHSVPEGVTPPLPRAGPPAGVPAPQAPAGAPWPRRPPRRLRRQLPFHRGRRRLRHRRRSGETGAPATSQPRAPSRTWRPSSAQHPRGRSLSCGRRGPGLLREIRVGDDWIGPTGRVLFGCTVSLAMMAGGLRLPDREYRPSARASRGPASRGSTVRSTAPTPCTASCPVPPTSGSCSW